MASRGARATGSSAGIWASIRRRCGIGKFEREEMECAKGGYSFRVVSLDLDLRVDGKGRTLAHAKVKRKR